MRKHGGTPSRRDKHVTLAAISPHGVARGRFVGGQQSGLAGSKPPPLFTRGASSCSSQGRRQGEPWGASPRPSAPTYLPTSTCCNWAVGPPGPLVRALHTAAKTSSPQTGPAITIPACDGGVLLEHGGGGTVSVPALGWLANSSMARGGLVGDAFAGVIAGRLLSPSRCVEGGVKAQGEEGVVSAWDLPGAPPLRSGGQNQKWPTCEQTGYLTPAVSGSPTASERGAKSEVAHKWANWVPHPCRIREPHRFRAGRKIRNRPQVGKLATSPLPYRGSPLLHSGGQNQKWPTCGQIGYLTPAVSGSPTASEGGPKSEVAHKWANWLPRPCRIGYPLRFRVGGKIRSGPLVGKLATSPLPYRVSPPLQSGGQNQKWPTCGQSGYLTPAVSESPTATERGAKSEVAHLWANWLPHPCRIGDPQHFRAGDKSEVAHKWAKWLPHPCRIGERPRFRAGGKIRSGPQVGKLATSPLPYQRPHRFRAGGKIRSGPLVGKLATSPLSYRGSPPLQSGR